MSRQPSNTQPAHPDNNQPFLRLHTSFEPFQSNILQPSTSSSSPVELSSPASLFDHTQPYTNPVFLNRRSSSVALAFATHPPSEKPWHGGPGKTTVSGGGGPQGRDIIDTNLNQLNLNQNQRSENQINNPSLSGPPISQNDIGNNNSITLNQLKLNKSSHKERVSLPRVNLSKSSAHI